jgi:hypothetical protein
VAPRPSGSLLPHRHLPSWSTLARAGHVPAAVPSQAGPDDHPRAISRPSTGAGDRLEGCWSPAWPVHGSARLVTSALACVDTRRPRSGPKQPTCPSSAPRRDGRCSVPATPAWSSSPRSRSPTSCSCTVWGRTRCRCYVMPSRSVACPSAMADPDRCRLKPPSPARSVSSPPRRVDKGTEFLWSPPLLSPAWRTRCQVPTRSDRSATSSRPLPTASRAQAGLRGSAGRPAGVRP